MTLRVGFGISGICGTKEENHSITGLGSLTHIEHVRLRVAPMWHNDPNSLPTGGSLFDVSQTFYSVRATIVRSAQVAASGVRGISDAR